MKLRIYYYCQRDFDSYSTMAFVSLCYGGELSIRYSYT